ncbi:MAG: hypothetical protein ACI9OD_002820 [Limisphaerales bacterium]|jgi:hypothetical protein
MPSAKKRRPNGRLEFKSIVVESTLLDADRFDPATGDRATLLTTASVCRFDISNETENVVTFAQTAEAGVLVVEECSIPEADKKLTPRAVRRLRASHGKHTAHMRTIVELGSDLVSRISRSPAMLFLGILRQRISALNHEPFHHAMKRGSVIESFIGEFLEILDRFGCNIRPEFQNYLAMIRLDYSDFTHA